MPIERQTPSKLQGPGPYLATITNVLDTSFMGALEVAIKKGTSADQGVQSQTYTVQYLMPFYGVTGAQFEGTDPREFDDVQKSYGMWFVPPDIGTTVLIIFIDGDPNQGYWIGCVPDKYQNHMIPGIAASESAYISPANAKNYGVSSVPVAEFHKRSAKSQINPGSQQKPVHPFTRQLIEAGLLADTIRGTTSSSARREAPSAVFGISTPGPINPSGRKGMVGYDTKTSIPVSRLGGTQFVMDDGDADGNNELVRIRTRTGHQILFHNTEDLIYIANGNGTAWIELTSDGKIDIYAEDSVSIHTKQDFNFMADRDVNIQAGRNFNLKAVDGNIRIETQDFNVKAAGDSKITTEGALHVNTGADSMYTAGGSTHINSGGNHLETASTIHMNGPGASTASSAAQMSTFKLPNTDGSGAWGGGKFYKSGTLDSIMKRVPTHEPWEQHENLNRDNFSSDKTSRD